MNCLGILRRLMSTALLLVLLTSCDNSSGGSNGGGGGGGGTADNYTCYLLRVILGDNEPIAKLTPPALRGTSPFLTPGISLYSRYNAIDIKIKSTNITGSNLAVTFEITNNTSYLLERIWLTVKSIDEGIIVEESSVSGHVGDGFYYFLKNISPSETVTVTANFIVTKANAQYSALVDVVSITDRVVFQWINELGQAEIWSMNYDTTDLFKVAGIDEKLYYGFIPTFSPDGGWISFTWGNPNESSVGLASADGRVVEKLTCFSSGYVQSWGFTPDLKKLYTRYFNPAVNKGEIYSLDIDAARADCSSFSSMTRITEDLPESVGEISPLPFNDGKTLFFARVVPKPIEPPYAEGSPNPTSCADWVFGTEGTLLFVDYYLVPIDPISGLPTGPERLFWERSLQLGAPRVTPDAKGMLLKTGGCVFYKWACSKGAWTTSCSYNLPNGIYKLKVPDDLSLLPFNYRDDAAYYERYPGSLSTDGHPFWCKQENRIVFSDADFNIVDCAPDNCAADRNVIFSKKGLKLDPQCTSAVVDP